MIAGHPQIKKGYYYTVLSWNSGVKRQTKWIPLGLPEKGNKRKAQVELSKIRREFVIPTEASDLSADMLFADYLLEWLEIANGRLAIATYSSLHGAYQKCPRAVLPSKEADSSGTGSKTHPKLLFRKAQGGET